MYFTSLHNSKHNAIVNGLLQDCIQDCLAEDMPILPITRYFQSAHTLEAYMAFTFVISLMRHSMESGFYNYYFKQVKGKSLEVKEQEK